MDINEICHFIYVCPICFGTYSNSFNLFKLSDHKPYKFRCADKSCGSVCAEIKKISGGKYNISTECPYCGETHTKAVSAKEIWTTGCGSVSCPVFGIKLFLYGGSKRALDNELAEAIIEAESIMRDTDDFLSGTDADPILSEMLMIFDRMFSEHSVNCICGSSDIRFDYINDKLYLICDRCGREKSFAATKDNLLRLMNASEVILGL